MSSLYNRYEPTDIAKVVGHKKIIEILIKISESNFIPNNFIFSGIGGCGKTLLARMFSKMINCLEKKKPCNQCSNCILINNGSSDIIECDGSTNTGVDYIRELQEMSYYTNLDLKYKVFIIDEVHMLSRNAFDSLLTILQSPPKHVRFMFATTNITKIPQTIISRCVVLPLSRLDNSLILEKLKEICECEKKNIPEKILLTISKNASGSLREAISLLETILFLDNWEENEIFSLLGFFSEETIDSIWNLIIHGKPSDAIEIWNKLNKIGYSEKAFLKEMSRWLKDTFLSFTQGKEFNWNVSFAILANFWEIITSQMEALYMDCSFVIETTITMLCFVKDSTTEERFN